MMDGMDESNFELLLESVKEAGAILRNEKEPTRTFICTPQDIKATRRMRTQHKQSLLQRLV
jgi:hypothetical protein